MTVTAEYMSPLGLITLVSDGSGLSGLRFEGQRHAAPPAGPAATGEDGYIAGAEQWLDAYFGGYPLPEPPVLSLRCTAFQRIIYGLLLKIPYGETVSYGELASLAARAAGRTRMSAQAVGGAVGRNPVALIVPCHRVIGADGSLTGYAAGLERKVWLLKHESARIMEKVSEKY